MATTVVQEIIKWTIENAFNIEGQDGTKYLAIDQEQMSKKFDEWLQRDKQQTINYHIGVIKIGLIEEGYNKWTDSYLPKIKEIANKYYDENFKEQVDLQNYNCKRFEQKSDGIFYCCDCGKMEYITKN